MSLEENKAIARRYFEEYLNEGKGVIGDDLFAPNYQAHNPFSPIPLDRQQHDHVSLTFYEAFPDADFTVEDMIAEGDRVVTRYTVRGIQRGTWFVIPGILPSGKPYALTGNEIHRIAGGRIVEQWSLADFYGLLRQSEGVPARQRAG